MKFKTIFIIFNAIIGISFVILFILPFIFLENSQFSIIFSTNWIILCVFILFIVAFNSYFIKNWKLFELIEKENWENLIKFIERKIYEEKKIGKNIVKILINCYIVTSKLEKIYELYQLVNQNKKKLVYEFSLEFSIPFLLIKTPSESESFFKELLDIKNLKNRLWIMWNYSFVCLRQEKKETAVNYFSMILNEKADPVLNLLTLYMYHPLVKNDPEQDKNVQVLISSFLNEYTVHSWEKYLENSKKNIQVIILSKIVIEASSWIFNMEKLGESDTLQ